jgi:hypothetical protein
VEVHLAVRLESPHVVRGGVVAGNLELDVLVDRTLLPLRLRERGKPPAPVREALRPVGQNHGVDVRPVVDVLRGRQVLLKGILRDVRKISDHPPRVCPFGEEENLRLLRRERAVEPGRHQHKGVVVAVRLGPPRRPAPDEKEPQRLRAGERLCQVRMNRGLGYIRERAHRRGGLP